jgi:hypothetical protein
VIGCGLADTEIEEVEIPHEQPDQNEDAKTNLSHQSEIERHDQERDEHWRGCASQIDEGVALDAHRLVSKTLSLCRSSLGGVCEHNTTYAVQMRT